MTAPDVVPLASMVSGGFLTRLIGYALKKVIKITAIIVGLFLVALAYLEFQRIIRRLEEASDDIAEWNYMAFKCCDTYLK